VVSPQLLLQSKSCDQCDSPANDVNDAKDLCRRRDTFFVVRDFIDRDCLEHVIRFAKCENPENEPETKQTHDAENQRCACFSCYVRSLLCELVR